LLLINHFQSVRFYLWTRKKRVATGIYDKRIGFQTYIFHGVSFINQDGVIIVHEIDRRRKILVKIAEFMNQHEFTVLNINMLTFFIVGLETWETATKQKQAQKKGYFILRHLNQNHKKTPQSYSKILLLQ